MAVIVPAILEKTKEGFAEKALRMVKLSGVQRIQVDFGDGQFVPNATLPASEIEPLNPAFIWEAHLMVKEPMDFLDYEISGFKTIIVHYEAYPNLAAIKNAINTIKQSGIEPGICINNETPVEVLEEFKDLTNHFLLMSVHPGFQGSEFLENTYQRIKELRSLVPKAIIEVDGGVNLQNIRKIADAGADLIVCGSSLVKAPSIQEAYEQLNKELY